MKGNGKISYKEIVIVHNVLVHVPGPSENMRQRPKQQIGSGKKAITIDDRWTIGQFIEGVILNKNFYNTKQDDLGKRAVCVVKVIKKTTKGGREFIMLDMIKNPNGAAPEYEMRIKDIGDIANDIKKISILGTKKVIVFVPWTGNKKN